MYKIQKQINKQYHWIIIIIAKHIPNIITKIASWSWINNNNNIMANYIVG